MDFIVTPLVVGIVFYFTYMTFELYARRNERMALIEKIGQNVTLAEPSPLKYEFGSLLPSFTKKSFFSLRFGCLMLGIGFGLLVGLFICLLMNTQMEIGHNRWEDNTFYSVAYGASVLFFGGMGLLISYAVESKSNKKSLNKS